ncbi:MAG TPA: hypothetical protein V6D19_07685 [Stenomitos sp.]
MTANPQDVLWHAIFPQELPKESQKPSTAMVIEALRQLERNCKNLPPANYEQLMGTWRLRFVSSAQQGKKTPKGRWIPHWLQISLTYTSEPIDSNSSTQPSPDRANAGTVYNQVQWSTLRLTLTGPTQFQPQQRILAFDFTRLEVQGFGHAIYQGSIRGGIVKEEQFYQLPLKQQAFFRMFWISPHLLAARGKGGGLALWEKV